jgi:hypothetical protein
MTDARIIVYDFFKNEKYPLNQPLSKYAENSNLVIHCEVPFRAAIKSTCKDVMSIVNESKILFYKKELDSFISRIKIELDKPYDPNNLDFDNDVLLYEVANAVKMAAIQGTATEIRVLKPPNDTTLCSFCGNRAHLQCGGCKTSYYCSKDCQITDWKITHKGICKICQREVFVSSDKLIWFKVEK